MQQQWAAKLFGYDFSIEYRSGSSNTIADALSRRGEEGELLAISFSMSQWLEELKNEHANDADIQHKLTQLKEGVEDLTQFTQHGGLLFFKGRFYLSPQSLLKSKVLSHLHDSPLGGHAGFHKTYQRVKREFFWKNLKGDVRQYVKECDSCQRNKA